MILLLDTSTKTCFLTLVADGQSHGYSWEADRDLAAGLLGFLEKTLEKHNMTFGDLSGIGVYRGPGSFTGLRIGITVANTLSDSLNTPVVGVEGDNWQEEAQRRLESQQNDKIVLPLYGRDANITMPRK